MTAKGFPGGLVGEDQPAGEMVSVQVIGYSGGKRNAAGFGPDGAPCSQRREGVRREPVPS
jgi:hypothetical protein